jgi:hypothetical protein
VFTRTSVGESALKASHEAAGARPDRIENGTSARRSRSASYSACATTIAYAKTSTITRADGRGETRSYLDSELQDGSGGERAHQCVESKARAANGLDVLTQVKVRANGRTLLGWYRSVKPKAVEAFRFREASPK